MIRRRRRDARAAILLACLAAAAAPALAQPDLQLVDDLGKPIGLPLEICFLVELKEDCRNVRPGEPILAPAGLQGLRIEGEEHGPLSVGREAIQGKPDTPWRIAIPRKAWVRVQAADRRAPLTLSLYRPGDASFREPAFRAPLQPGVDTLRVPAGDFVAALTEPGSAPDLQRLAAKPAGRHSLVYHRRQGWSLIARCRSAATLSAVPGAEVDVVETIGYGQAEKKIAHSVAGPDGLVLFSGIQAGMAGLVARHPRFMLTELRGLTASPGTFAFRDADLANGGTVSVLASLHGKPLTQAVCQVFSLDPDAADPRSPFRLLWEAPVDRLGTCRSSRLAQGQYKLRVRAVDTTSQVIRWVTVSEGQETELDLALNATRVFGEVRRGGEPASGYSIEALLIDLDRPSGARGGDLSAEAVSDEAGEYELTLWSSGWFGLKLRSPSKAPAAGHREIWADGGGEKKIDFDLDESALRGTVVDDQGRPVAEASVGLRWKGMLVAPTDAEGKFTIDVQGEGAGELTATKRGYRESEAVEVRVSVGAAPPPVTLVLKRKTTLRGTIRSGAGAPLAGAWVASVGHSLQAGPFLYSSTRSTTDGEFEVELPSGAVRLFGSGPGCPLFWFDPPTAGPGLPDGEETVALSCPLLPATVELEMTDDAGQPLALAAVILKSGGAIVPGEVLASHLRLLGLPAQSDGAGRLVLAGLMPGEYDLFLSGFSSEGTIAGGARQGFLTTVSLPPLATTTLRVTVPARLGSPRTP